MFVRWRALFPVFAQGPDDGTGLNFAVRIFAIRVGDGTAVAGVEDDPVVEVSEFVESYLCISIAFW